MPNVNGSASPSNQFVGDRSAGCACAYTFLEQHPVPRRRQPSGERDGVANVDTYATSTGRGRTRYFCHRGLTGAYPRPIDSPPPYRARSVAETICSGAKRTFWSVFRFMFPRIQFAMGINLWRFRA